MLATSELAQAWQRYVLNGFIFPQVKPTCEPPQSTIGDAAASALLFASAFDWLRLDPLVGIIGARHVSETWRIMKLRYGHSVMNDMPNELAIVLRELV